MNIVLVWLLVYQSKYMYIQVNIDIIAHYSNGTAL